MNIGQQPVTSHCETTYFVTGQSGHWFLLHNMIYGSKWKQHATDKNPQTKTNKQTKNFSSNNKP